MEKDNGDGVVARSNSCRIGGFRSTVTALELSAAASGSTQGDAIEVIEPTRPCECTL
jgi:hypothetical protein